MYTYLYSFKEKGIEFEVVILTYEEEFANIEVWRLNEDGTKTKVKTRSLENALGPN